MAFETWRAGSLLVSFVALLAASSAQDLTDAHLCGGGRHSCFLNGTRISCWGEEEYGNNQTPTGEFSAVAFVSLVGAPAGDFSAVACGSWHSCGIRADTKKVECFGSGYALHAAPTAEPVLAVSAGFAHSCAVLAQDLSLSIAGDPTTPSTPLRVRTRA
ncbi:hypothetical protein T484DRAFT_1918393 [Baffinella frigidus]|nr:hypothetical protein T484DRAFT_1918393 [Cryptophyta sp. CCMP2293]